MTAGLTAKTTNPPSVLPQTIQGAVSRHVDLEHLFGAGYRYQ
jgi:hypothetical protein